MYAFIHLYICMYVCFYLSESHFYFDQNLVTVVSNKSPPLRRGVAVVLILLLSIKKKNVCMHVCVFAGASV